MRSNGICSLQCTRKPKRFGLRETGTSSFGSAILPAHLLRRSALALPQSGAFPSALPYVPNTRFDGVAESKSGEDLNPCARFLALVGIDLVGVEVHHLGVIAIRATHA